jgi:hypothetical protein
MTAKLALDFLTSNVNILILIIIGIGFLVFKLHMYYIQTFTRIKDYEKDKKNEKQIKELTLGTLNKQFEDFQETYKSDYASLNTKLNNIYDLLISKK